MSAPPPKPAAVDGANFAPGSDNAATLNALDAIAAFYAEHTPTVGTECATLLLRLNAWAAGGTLAISYEEIAQALSWSRRNAISKMGELQKAGLVKRLPVLASQPNRWQLSDAGAFFAPSVTASANTAPSVTRGENLAPPVTPPEPVVTHASARDEHASSSLREEELEKPTSLRSVASATTRRPQRSARRSTTPLSPAERIAAITAEREAWVAAQPDAVQELLPVLAKSCACSTWRTMGADAWERFAAFVAEMADDGVDLEAIGMVRRAYYDAPMPTASGGRVALNPTLFRRTLDKLRALDEADAEATASGAPARAAPPTRAERELASVQRGNARLAERISERRKRLNAEAEAAARLARTEVSDDGQAIHVRQLG